MIFTSLVFLFLFLPVTLFFYYIASPRYRQTMLFVASLVFYTWGGFSFSAVLAGSILLNYVSALLMDRSKTIQGKKAWFLTGLLGNLLLLIFFKYTLFIVENVNVLITVFGMDPFLVNAFFLPLGISFFTFKAISYLISVKRGEVPAERNIIRIGLFISLFPSLLAGPIDRYRTLSPQIRYPEPSLELFVSGIRRFSLGLLKKLFIADQLAGFSSSVLGLSPNTLDASVAWFGALVIALEIYMDFSAYTDMAIGLGRMVGLRLMENFDYPYRSKSVHDFWRRWHISLSFWLRDYVFLPLAFSISRKLKRERYGGIRTDYLIYMPAAIITFVLCGLWHGAAWTFLVWGLFHGLFLVMERIGLEKWLRKRWKGVSHLYLLLFILFSWIIFRSDSTKDAFTYMGSMLGYGEGQSPHLFIRILTTDYELMAALFLAILAASGGFRWIPAIWRRMVNGQPTWVSISGYHLMQVGSILFVALSFFLAVLYLIAKTNTPFLYMQF